MQNSRGGKNKKFNPQAHISLDADMDLATARKVRRVLREQFGLFDASAISITQNKEPLCADEYDRLYTAIEAFEHLGWPSYGESYTVTHVLSDERQARRLADRYAKALLRVRAAILALGRRARALEQREKGRKS